MRMLESGVLRKTVCEESIKQCWYSCAPLTLPESQSDIDLWSAIVSSTIPSWKEIV